MSFEEKRAWIYAVITLVVPLAYFALVLGGVFGGSYVGPLFGAVGVAVAFDILANLGAAASSPKDAGQTDERDAEIRRFGQYIEYHALIFGVIAALGLTMAELAHFWIAHALYGAFVLSSLAGAAARIASYRRGAPLW